MDAKPDIKPADSTTNESSAKVSDVEVSGEEESNAEKSVKGSGDDSSLDFSSVSIEDNSVPGSSPVSNASKMTAWARNLTFPRPVPPQSGNLSPQGSGGMSSKFARLTSDLGLNLASVTNVPDEKEKAGGTPTGTQSGGVFGSLTKGLVDTSKNAVKAMQVKARHVVSQNKRRYQEGDFDLDMTYITENIIAMGFPAGDISSGLFGYIEGFYRNHVEEVIRFFETNHKGKYKVYNLCSERLYNAALFQGKVASFPFDDHNCPPIQLIPSFCQSAYSWLKEDISNVVVIHCKAGMARTGLMICSLLLYLKFFPTADEAILYYNQKRCVDGKALVLPSQIRYVKYFERILTYFNGEVQPPRRCMLRGFRLHQCPYWIRPSITISNHSGILFSTRRHPKTKDLMPEDFWLRAPKKGIVVFALPGEPGLTELSGDFKIHFHDHQGDFYCWLNTTMTENRKFLDGSELDGFDKRKLPSPGFKVELVMIDFVQPEPSQSQATSADQTSDGQPVSLSVPTGGVSNNSGKASKNDDVFSDSDGEQTPGGASKSRQGHIASGVSPSNQSNSMAGTQTLQLSSFEPKDSKQTTVDSSKNSSSAQSLPHLSSVEASDFKAIAADASVFSFGDEDDESE